MCYEFKSRVRYSEVDVNQNLTLNSVINYFQDCSTFQSEDIGLGIARLHSKKRAWLLSSWQIVMERFPLLGEGITIQTWPYDFKGFCGNRNFAMLDEDGSRIASANSLWVFVNLETGHPVKMEADDIAGYELKERLPMEYASRKIAIPKESVEKERYSVLKYQLDTNHHVNNGQYIQMAHEFLPDHFKIRQMRAEYKKAAVLHDVIVPRVHFEKESCTIALCDEAGKPYAIVNFEQ